MRSRSQQLLSCIGLRGRGLIGDDSGAGEVCRCCDVGDVCWRGVVGCGGLVGVGWR